MKTVEDHAGAYWFPAKTYGWGWGPPVRWQGWVVLAVYLVAMVLVSVFIGPVEHPYGFAIGVVVASSALVFICWLKGEPTPWRLGRQAR